MPKDPAHAIDLSAGDVEAAPDLSAGDVTATAPSEPGILEPHQESGVLSHLAGLLRGGVGATVNMVAHPIDTAMGMGRSVVTSGISPSGYPIFAPTGTSPEAQARDAENQQVKQQLQQESMAQGKKLLTESPGYTVGSLLGPPLILHGLAKAVPAVADAASNVGRKSLAALTDTGPNVTRNAVADTLKTNFDARQQAIADNAAATAKAQEATAKAAADHAKATADVEAENTTRQATHAKRTAAVEASNTAAQAEHEANLAKAEELKQAAAETESQRGALARQVQEQGARMVNRVQRVQQTSKAKVDSMYSDVRDKVGDASVPSDNLSSAVTKAEQRLQGSTENIKIFRDILGKTADDDFVVSGGAKFGPGSPVYESVRSSAGGLPEAAAKPLTFSDLQGYYSELGDKLSAGNLPGDVYQAMKSLQNDVGGMMKKMATERGAGALLSNAQSYYRNYMETFREPTGPQKSGSPLAQSLQAKDPTYAVKPLAEPETAQRVRNMLAEFDPAVNGQGGGAQLYDNFLKANSAYEGLPKPEVIARALSAQPPSAPKLKAAPEPPRLKPVPEAPQPVQPKLVQPDVQQLGPEEIQRLKADRVFKKAENIRNKSGLATTIMALDMIRNLYHGNISGIGEDLLVRGTYELGKQELANTLQKPAVTEWLSRLSAADVAELAKLPPEQRTATAQQLTGLVAEAHRRGIPVSPALTTFIATAAVPTAQHSVGQLLTQPPTAQH